MLSGKSLDAATSVGPGVAFYPDTPKTSVSIQSSCTGSSSGTSIFVECTVDGVNWDSMISGPADGAIHASTSPKPFIGFRANLLTIGSGGSITSWIAAA